MDYVYSRTVTLASRCCNNFKSCGEIASVSSVVRCVLLVQFSRLYRLVAIAELRVHSTINGIIIRVRFSGSARTKSGPDPEEDLRFDVWPAIHGSVR